MRRMHGLNFNGFRRSIRQGLVALLAAFVVIPLAVMAPALSVVAFTGLFRWRKHMSMPVDALSVLAYAGHHSHQSLLRSLSGNYIHAIPLEGLRLHPQPPRLGAIDGCTYTDRTWAPGTET